MNIKGQGHSLTFVQGHSDSTFSNFFSFETPRPIEDRFHMEPPWDGGMKVSTTGLCRFTKMAAMSIYGKTLKILLLWNKKADDLKTWYAILLTQVLPNLPNDDPGLTMTYFTARPNLGECLSCRFPRNY